MYVFFHSEGSLRSSCVPNRPLTSYFCCRTRMLWEGCARRGGRSLTGPHPYLFSPELHLYTGPCLNYTMMCLCWSCTSLILTLTWFPSLSLDLPHPYGPTRWSGLWLTLATTNGCTSALLGGGLWGCISCEWGPCTAGHAVTLVPTSLHPVAQPQLLPDIQFHNSFNGSKLWLLEVCFCPCRSLSPLHRSWYLSDFTYLLFQELKQI